jgi:single-strand DNA-binding protein
MEDLNVVVVGGRATRDPELKYTASGTAVANVSIAVNRNRKAADGSSVDEASFFDVVAWERTAEVAAQFIKKGKAITVIGTLKQDRWTTPEGDPRSKVVIHANRILLGRDATAAVEPPGSGEPL